MINWLVLWIVCILYKHRTTKWKFIARSIHLSPPRHVRPLCSDPASFQPHLQKSHYYILVFFQPLQPLRYRFAHTCACIHTHNHIELLGNRTFKAKVFFFSLYTSSSGKLILVHGFNINSNFQISIFDPFIALFLAAESCILLPFRYLRHLNYQS